MDFNHLMDPANLKSDVVALVVVVLALLLILLLNRKGLLAKFQEWRIQRSLNRIGSEQLRDLVCPDGLDGYYNIDRLALVGDAILVIVYKPYGGNIYCAEHISEWTQVVGQKSFKFENPLFELENQLTALRMLIGGANLRGYLFFGRSATFPKGHPPAVLHPGNLPQSYLAPNCVPPAAEIQAAWDLLKSIGQQQPRNDRIGVET